MKKIRTFQDTDVPDSECWTCKHSQLSPCGAFSSIHQCELFGATKVVSHTPGILPRFAICRAAEVVQTDTKIRETYSEPTLTPSETALGVLKTKITKLERQLTQAQADIANLLEKNAKQCKTNEKLRNMISGYNKMQRQLSIIRATVYEFEKEKEA